MPVNRFFEDVDSRWNRSVSDPERIDLHLIGCTALMLQTDHTRGTKDSDVIETTQITDDIRSRLLQLAGKGTALHQRNRIYIDIVKSGVPFLPQQPRWHAATNLSASLAHFRVMVLDVVDVVVSKLKPYRPSDENDIEAMVERGLVGHQALVSRFRSAVDWFSMDARAPDCLPRYIENLHRVERDILAVRETDIDLPHWLS